jgi:hypothetical protein
MRKALIVILVFFVIVIPAVHAALNTPWLIQKIVRRAFVKLAPKVSLKEFSVASQKYYWPSHFEFGDIKLELELNGKVLKLACSRVEIDDLLILRETREFDLWVDSTDMTYDFGRTQNARAELKVVFPVKGGYVLQGPVSAQVLTWDRASAERVSAEFLVDEKGLYFDLLKGEAFNGSFTGGVDVFYTNPPVYSVRLSLKDMDTEKLTSISPQVVEQVSGRVIGEVNFAGSGNELTDFLADLSMPSGGRVNASFLATLTQYLPTLSNYLPSSQEKARFESLIKSGGKLAVETLSFSIRNDSSRHLAAALSLASREANINWNLTYDITVDGTWEDLLRSWQAIFK